uniref:RING-type domain-containing protein n=1 Tax=Amphilophus citrinellus TaxID=61819 RepID=A0A3Q0SJU0_AMPCI
MSTKLWTEEQFNCPVCLDLPNDPVTIPCGHSYCMACIKDYWSKDDPKGIYSCPQCLKIHKNMQSKSKQCRDFNPSRPSLIGSQDLF